MIKNIMLAFTVALVFALSVKSAVTVAQAADLAQDLSNIIQTAAQLMQFSRIVQDGYKKPSCVTTMLSTNCTVMIDMTGPEKTAMRNAAIELKQSMKAQVDAFCAKFDGII